MKRKWIGLMSLVCMFAAAVSPMLLQAEEPPGEPDRLYAQSAVLMDGDSGRVLFGKEEDKIRPMASTTKIMTCILTLECMEEAQTAKVSSHAAGQPKVRLGVREGELYYVRDLLYSLMLESHNDSAVVIAEAIGGSVEHFAEMMNQKAAGLGCKDTHFVTPNGLDAEDEGGVHATTAGDLARILRYCIRESPRREAFLSLTRTRDYAFQDMEGRRSFSCHNHNAFLDMMDGALTGKTGFTANAGYCYVGALERDGKLLIVALLACGWPNHRNYKWEDTKKLMEYGLSHYEYRNVWKKPEVEEIPVAEAGLSDDEYAGDVTVPAGVEGEGELSLLLRPDEEVQIKKERKKLLHAPVKKGEKIGTLSYLLDGKPVAVYEIVTLQGREKRDYVWCFLRLLVKICL